MSSPAKKLTLTQFKRFLPIQPPPDPPAYPQNINRYFSSPAFSNLSITQQTIIEQKYKIAYRNYYTPQTVVDYIGKITGNKFTAVSILKAVCNCAQKYEVIDWFKLIRVTMKGSEQLLKKKEGLGESDLVNEMIRLFRRFLKKRVIWRGVEEIGEIKKNLQQKVLQMFMNESYTQVREAIQKNRIHSQSLLYQFQKQNPQYVNFIQLEKLVNGKLQLYMDRKKVGYLYLFFDYPNKGYFTTSSLLSQLLVVKKQKVIKSQTYYLTNLNELMERIREEMRLIFYSAHQMLNDFGDFYEQQCSTRKITNEESEEIDKDLFYLYISEKCKNRYSRYHIDKIHAQIIYKENLQFLFNKPKGKGFAEMLLRMVEKKKKKRQLKKENDIFYSYKTILLHLVSKCKKTKLTRQEFYNFISDIDPLLKYRSFYCVWRVYPGIINVERMKKNCNLNPLACYLKLRKNDQEYDQIFQEMLGHYPPEIQVNYEKVEQRINLGCDFVLQLTRIKPLPLDPITQVNYHKAMNDIFQPDFDIQARKYIHTKIAQKAYAMWKGYLAAKQAKQKFQILKFALNDINKQSIDSKQSPSKKMSTQKSKASLQTKKSQTTKINPQTLQIVKWNIEKLLNELHLQNKAVMRQFHTEKYKRKHLCLNPIQNYIFRTSTPRISLHEIQGVIGLGQQLMFLKDGKMEKIRIKFLYKPGIEIIDFTKNENDVVLLTSYFSLEFYNMSQQSPYSYQTIELLDEVTRITGAILDRYCQDRVYSKYPVFLRSYGRKVMINSSLIDKKIKMIDTESRKVLHEIAFTQKEHMLNGTTLRMIQMLEKHPRKNKIANQLIIVLAQNYPSEDKIYAILQDDTDQAQKQNQDSQPLCSTIKQARQIARCFGRFNSALAICVFKEQMGMIKKRKIPESLADVIEAMVEYMEEKNISLKEVIDIIDRQEEGIIKMKALKDYLLKITQQVYSYHEKEIDSFLKSLVVGRDVSYEAVCEIMLNWKYAIWERPHILIRDFVFIQDSSLLFYTIQGQNCVYAKNFKDNNLISVLPDHDTTPCIEFIPERYVLISGDLSKIRIWRIYDDLIGKFNQLPPWEMFPYAIVSAHQDLITSITYLSRAHTLVTTSLDSTAKFWSINPQVLNKQQHKHFLSEIKRIYSEEDYFLNSRTQLSKIDNQGCMYETLVLAKVSKQINQNNKFKFESKIQVFEVQNSVIEAGKKNIYLQLPPKLTQMLERHAQSIGSKKKVLMAKKIKEDQTSIIKANLITKNLQNALYQAVKRYYIFGSSAQLIKITNFLSKRPGSQSIYLVLMQTYGIGIPSKNQMAPIPDTNIQLMNPKLMASQIYKISIPKQEYDVLMHQINLKCSSIDINIDFLISIASQMIFGITFQAFKDSLMAYLDSNPILKERNKITKQQIQNLFATYQLSSEIQVLYAVLRTIQVLLASKKMGVWQIFCNNQVELEKKNRIQIKLFSEKMKEIGLDENRINLILSYLGRSDFIYLQDFIYYLKVAWSVVSIDLAASNFSQIFMKNSRMLESRLQKFKLDSGIEIKQQSLEEKLNRLDVERKRSKDRKSNDQSISRKSSQKNEKKLKEISELDDQSIDKSKSKDKSRSVSRKKSDGKDDKSYLHSSSHSRVSLSHQSFTKDSFSRQTHHIVKSLKQKLKNEGKSLWELCSVAVLDFMESSTISQPEYFNIFKSLNSPVLLRDKLHLMQFIMRQSNQFSTIDINLLFQLFETHQPQQKTSGSKIPSIKIYGEKYIISFIIAKITEQKMALQHALINYFFEEKQELTMEEILQILARQPFNMQPFCLKEFQVLLISENKSGFVVEEFKQLIESRMSKYNIKSESKQVGYIDELIHRIYDRNMKLQDIIVKPQNNALINFEIFKGLILTFFNVSIDLLENEFVKIVSKVQAYRQAQVEKQKLKQSPVKATKLKGSPKKQQKDQKKMKHKQIIQKATFKYKQLLRYINQTIQDIKSEVNTEKDSVRKFIRTLQAKKINLLTFFISLDSNRTFFINQTQFKTGLAELKINNNFWPSIQKKRPKRLYYSELINYLIQKQVVSYKCVDSELDAAMTKFMRRFMRNDDLQTVFDRIRDKEGEDNFNATYQSFHKALRLGNAFKDKETFYIFSAFVNSENLKKSIFSNDEIIKDQANYHKTFNFKMFTDTVSNFRNQNITKTPHYRFCSYLKKRGVSLLNEFIKWMDRNKKIKQIGQALKNKEQTIGREFYSLFIKDMGTGLTDKEIKELMTTYPNPLDFSVFNQKLEQMYKKGNMNMEAQQISNYFQIICKKIKNSNTNVQRLFEDFSSCPQKMNIKQLSQLCRFLETGLTKIQIRAIFGSMDLQKKQFITMHQLQDAIEQANETIQKEEDEYQLDYAIQKLLTNTDKYALKPSRIKFTTDRASIVFSSVLSKQQSLLVYQNALLYLKLNQMTEDHMKKYLNEKQQEIKAKKDKKYKQLILNFLKFIRKINIDTSQAYSYFAKDNGKLTKNKFLLLYQSLELRTNIVEINALYSYLDEKKTGQVSQDKWDQKLNIVQYEKENADGLSGEQLQVFYKAKLILSEIYLIFIRKLFRPKQMHSYFDIHSNGILSHSEFINSVEQLGVSLENGMDKRLLNYLDRQRSGDISINLLIFQLQNCLGSKQKTILEAKSSCIFKSKIHLIQQKQQYFIDRLVGYENFISLPIPGDLKGQSKNQSCILATQFLGLIKDFGIVLDEDQFSDVQRNFKANKDNLKLYPLYFMFVNIFKSVEHQFSSDTMERRRYQRLFQALIKNGLTMKIFQKVLSVKEATNFLTQLKIFTPIQVKLLIESITPPDSHVIELSILSKKIRDSYLQGPDPHKSITFLIGQSDRCGALKTILRQSLNPDQVINSLKANSGRISKDTFQKLLCKLNLIFTSSQVTEFFQAFANGKEYVLIEQLISQNPQVETQKQIIEEPQKDRDLLLDHICKSLNFKGVSLTQAWQKYYLNYGFITQPDFYSFLQEIGFIVSEKDFQKSVQSFLDTYYQQSRQTQIKTSLIEKMMIKRGHIPHKKSQIPKYEIVSFILSQIEQKISFANQQQPIQKIIKTFIEENYEYPNNEAIPVSLFYNFVKKFIKNSDHEKLTGEAEKYIKFYVNQLIGETVISLKKLFQILKKRIAKRRIPTQEDVDIIVKDLSADVLPKQSQATSKQLVKVCQQNFLWTYNKTVDQFYGKVDRIRIPKNNLSKLALNFLFEKLLVNDYLVYLEPLLGTFKITQNQHKKKSGYYELDQRFKLKTMANLIVEKQEMLKGEGIWKINDKYLGMNVSEKNLFEQFAVVSSLLDPDATFLRAKNYYLWDPNDLHMPKCAINYRWKFIAPVCLFIAKQLQTVHDSGYAMPHLRWNHLQLKKGIYCSPFPCKLDSMGKIQSIPHRQLFRLDDPYCLPQLFWGHSGKYIESSYSAWIMGCMFYQFVWGHSPRSFMSQLIKYVHGRHCPIDLEDVFNMQQLPSDFIYVPFQFDHIYEVLKFEHCVKIRDTVDQLPTNIKYFGLKGLLKSLEQLYGDEYMYFKEEFNSMQKILQIIIDCLNPLPKARPSLQMIISRLESLCIEEKSVQFLEVLNNHDSAIQLNKQFLTPLREAFSSNNHKQTEKLVALYEQKIQKAVNNTSIRDIFCIPKYYPWPLSLKNQELRDDSDIFQEKPTFSLNLLKKKQKIRSHSSVNITTLLQEQNCFEMLMNLYLRLQKQEVKQRVFHKLFKLLMLSFESLRNYQSPFAGFIPNLLQSFIQLIFDQPFTFQERESAQTQCSPQNFGRSLQLPSISKIYKQKAINYFKRVVYLDGNANVEYLPLHHFMKDNLDYRVLFQYFYTTVSLAEGNLQEKQLALNYFRDRMTEEFFWHIICYIKIDSIVFHLLDEEQTQENSLLFFRQISAQASCEELPLFYSNIFYLKMGNIITQTLMPIERKIISIQIVTNLVRFHNMKIFKKLNQQAFSMMKEVLKLAVEPMKDTSEHEQYEILSEYMKELVDIMYGSKEMMDELQNIEGAQFILDSFCSRRVRQQRQEQMQF